MLLRRRVFIPRNIVIETLCESDGTFRAIYNLISAIIACHIFLILIQYYADENIRDQDVEFFFWCFGNLKIVAN